ncbi:hypothetical protein H310_03784 [Aphanomyces invadans]|uniref:C2H2-type domain-containing protein n=1 Tax=Aphanomyces invadans TaxID=157072 RepID=A0A024UEC8_9STRA|nr:hypothetical protein H310_03784 [Aphanomyces invadans]ETW04560.1 hypothetical protein H310_03784 [Aphanomyces invadans]|eukprot:XP_008865998.1 hypothetical protein H310_03784 [Aphanomyces invadans]
MAKHGTKQRNAATHPRKGGKKKVSDNKTRDVVQPVKKKVAAKVKHNVPLSLHLNAHVDASASSAFLQANISNPNPKIVGGVSDRHRVLVVGDGDFSFSLALATRLESAAAAAVADGLGGAKFVATVYDSEAELLAKYPNVSANIRGLKVTQAQIHVGVDATNLKREQWIRNVTFDRILFNFPHLGGATEDDVEKNQDLLHRFFKSARDFLDDSKGEIHVALRNTLFYNRWDVAGQAVRAGLKHKRTDRFDVALYPGYEAQRTHPASFRGEPPSTQGAKTYVFAKDATFVEPVDAVVPSAKPAQSKPKKSAEKAAATKSSWQCLACKAHFNLQTKYNAHINSAKHAKTVKAQKKKK